MKKKILTIMPYENIYPPKNGGMQRCFHIFHQLAKHTDLTAITHSSSENLLAGLKDYPALASAKIFSTGGITAKKFNIPPALNRLYNAIRYRWLVKDFTKGADGSFLSFYPILKKLLRENEFDYIILENGNPVIQAPLMRKLNKRAKIIYNAYNVDSILAFQSGIETPQKKKKYEQLLNFEQHLYRFVDGIFCCSDIDQMAFHKLNNNQLQISFVLPNGVDTTLYRHQLPKSAQMKNILFCGSLDYPPNKNGLLWFYKNSWPIIVRKMEDCKLYIVGRGSKQGYEDLINDINVNFIGEVEDVREWYYKCNVALAPLLQGSGTRLKIMEAMSIGNPVVSTAIGADGIKYHDGENIMIANDPIDFSEKILALSSDEINSQRISKNGRHLVETNYSWDNIGDSLNDFLNTSS